MSTLTAKQELIARLDELTDTEIEALLEHLEVLRYARVMNSMTLPDDYRIENDGTVGFLSGTTDLAEQIEDILYGEPEIEHPQQKVS